MRRTAAGIAAAAMLFAQLAVAAHACAASSGAPASAALTAAHAGHDVPPCHEADPAPDNICLQHLSLIHI